MDDLAFVQECAKGDRKSWEAFVNKYSRLIYNYIHAVLRAKGIDFLTAQNTNDLFQEIFLLLVKDNFKKLKSFKAKNGCSLASWLRQLVINHTIDHVRKVRPLVSLDEENESRLNLKDVISDNALSASDTVLHKERILALQECIEKLDTDERYFLELHIHQDVSLNELKDHFKLARGTIDMRKARIIEKLKSCFQRKGFIFADNKK